MSTPYNTGRVRIGAHWRDSQISASTPRVRGDVEYMGTHAERLQSAYLNPPARRRIADVLLTVVLGVSLAAVLFLGLSS
jgi:hypothetical protein